MRVKLGTTFYLNQGFPVLPFNLRESSLKEIRASASTLSRSLFRFDNLLLHGGCLSVFEDLQAEARILDIISERRAQTGNEAIGWAIERAILDRCLSTLDESARTRSAEIHE